MVRSLKFIGEGKKVEITSFWFVKMHVQCLCVFALPVCMGSSVHRLSGTGRACTRPAAARM